MRFAVPAPVNAYAFANPSLICPNDASYEFTPI